jgi:long-subunit fatty acid transport protein
LGNVFPILNGNVQQAINVIEGGGLNHWSFGGSVDIAKNLSFGASLNYATGSYSYDQTVNENDTKNFYPASIAPRDFNQFTYESTINDEITGFNALLGLMFRYPEKYSIGFSIRTATTYSIKETYGESGSSQFKTLYQGESAYSFPLTSNSIKYEVTTPYTLSAGVSILPFEWLRLAGDAEYTDWTQMELRADGVDFSLENSRIKNQMRATVNLRGGGELSLLKLGLKLRGGIIYNPSPWKHDPSSRDQLYYTAGIGYMLDESTSIDAGFAYGTWKTLRTNYSYSAAGVLNDVGTDESVTTSNLNITLMVHF